MAYLWFGLAAMSVVLAFVAKSGVMVSDELDIALPLLLVLGVFLYGKAARARDIARRLAQPTVDELLDRDTRAHVLYLRSFGIDARLRQVPGGFLQRGTEEEQLVRALNRIGPVVAVGRPGEALPELGAARLYLEDSAWQREVMRLMDDAALVVLLLGPSGGLRWELQTVLERLEPQRLVILSALTRRQMHVMSRELRDDLSLDLELPRPRGRGARVDGTETAHEAKLVEQGYEPGTWSLTRDDRGKWRWLRSRLQVYRDTGDDEERVITLIDSLYHVDRQRRAHREEVAFARVPLYRRSLTHAATDAFLVALRPVFAALGVAWRPPPVAVFRLMLLAAVVALFVAPLLVTLFDVGN